MLGLVFLPSVARALTLGVKYALYSDALLSIDLDLSLASKAYEKKGMQMRNQMASYISNNDGNQKEGLLRFLYASMLFANTDLSQTRLTYADSAGFCSGERASGEQYLSSTQEMNSPPENGKSMVNDDDLESVVGSPAQPAVQAAQMQDSRNMLRAFSRDAMGLLRGVADFDAVFTSIDTNHDGHISVDEFRVAGMSHTHMHAYIRVACIRTHRHD